MDTVIDLTLVVLVLAALGYLADTAIVITLKRQQVKDWSEGGKYNQRGQIK